MLCPCVPGAAALVTLALVASSALAAPFVGHHAPPDHWAQLLHAGRFDFIERPTWLTHGDPGDASQDDYPLSVPSLSRTLDGNATSRAIAYTRVDAPLASQSDTVDADLANSAMRTANIFKGNGDRSTFTIHAFNEPSNLQIQRVMKKCLEIIEESWVSSVPVLMKISFTDLGEPNILARGGGTYFVKMPDLFETALPVAAAEAIRERDLNGNEKGDLQYDVLITMNSRSPWFDGTTGNPSSSQYDLCTVILHEIYHNIVFAGAVQGKWEKKNGAHNGLLQTATLYKGYRTRYDAFLANKDHCSVMGYLSDTQLAKQQKCTTEELFGNSMANDGLYFAYQDTRVAKLYAPGIFKEKSSVYHLDFSMGDENSLMHATVKRGHKQHTVSPTIREIQAAILNVKLTGAKTNCARPMHVPFGPVWGGGFKPVQGGVPSGGGGIVIADDEVPHSDDGEVARAFEEDNVNLIGGLPVWAFALIILFSVLLALLLCGLCLALLRRCLKRRGNAATKYTSSKGPSTKFYKSSSSRGSATSRTSRSQTIKTGTYIPGMGNKVSSSFASRKAGAGVDSRRTSSRSSSSKRTPSRHTTLKSSTKPTSTKSSSKRSKSAAPEVVVAPVVCPSSGKTRVICKCKCCCKDSITRPAPVASVHTFDPESVPNTSRRAASVKDSSRKHSSTKVICKKKSSRRCHQGCHCYNCCRYKPASSRATSKCSKTICKSVTTKCESYKCESRCAPSSSKCTKCSVSSSRVTSCRVPSTKPPSTKPPCVKPPSTKPPSTRAPTAKVASSSKCLKASGRRCGCYSCKNVVEINVGYRC